MTSRSREIRRCDPPPWTEHQEQVVAALDCPAMSHAWSHEAPGSVKEGSRSQEPKACKQQSADKQLKVYYWGRELMMQFVAVSDGEGCDLPGCISCRHAT